MQRRRARSSAFRHIRLQRAVQVHPSPEGQGRSLECKKIFASRAFYDMRAVVDFQYWGFH